ncbi:DUF3886 domain-containing protein [Bacillus sp. V3-13]|uniref:YqkE family protein n=1 Tax=Bacillus sp. V3-13 TaxID=2053728 RepID=UPI000C7593D2|nr:YqkE family protein [Bacillus sp. V3-13]PLR76392.1 DUF3886 domain-containing protein [Bacillus sp. V3-13]
MRKKSVKQASRQKEDKAVTLGDMLNQDLMEKLKEKQKELKSEEIRKQEEEAERKREERRLKEKNKSFAELLQESDLDWKKYK